MFLTMTETAYASSTQNAHATTSLLAKNAIAEYLNPNIF